VAPLLPVIAGTRVSAATAMRAIGLGKGHFGTSWLDRLLQSVTATAHFISRPMRISLRNTIRRKARLLLTLSTLRLGGAIFIAVLSVHASLMKTLDDALSYWNYDVDVNFVNPHRIAEIEREALKVPGVIAAESWIGSGARRLRPDGIEGENFSFMGTPAETTMIQPTLLEGRWLLPEDENAVVINSSMLDTEPDLKVGDQLTVKIEERESTWLIVGIVRGVMTGPLAYANYPYLAKEVRFIGRSGGVQIIGETKDPEAQTALAEGLKTYFENMGMRVRSTNTTASTRANITNQFNIIVFFLTFMAILIALVGGLGLMGTMSMNVMERTREIGVMRAVGADDGAILRVVLVEGLFIGLLSWFIGTLAALPISQLMSNMVGLAFLQAPLSYTFSLTGALLWLGLVLLLSGIASFLPSWNASRLTIREVLAYE
jgi:putative ABC transport system permease protein